MQIKSILEDKKVSAKSVLIELSIRDYLELAKKIYRKNNFQRRRVRSSKTVYSLLKTDMLQGCVIPPVVLAYTKPAGTLEASLHDAIRNDSDHFVLLDGLQRSLTLMDVESETAGQPDVQQAFLDRTMRCEIYEGINKIGILYRMLTLNTGQTPMSVRHQIEIMYQDYLDVQIEGITLLREADARRARQPNCYNFRDVIEGLNSYLERSESPLDRGDILDNISSLESLAKENDRYDVFTDFLTTWNQLIQKITSFDLKHPTEQPVDDPDEPTSAKVWGTSGVQVFKRAQAISGFGAAIGMLRDEDETTSFGTLDIDNLVVGMDHEEFMLEFNELMQTLNSRAKRIGNAQRLFFRQFFKMLFWEESGAYLNMARALNEGFKSATRIGI
ncbi:hypothetical protein KBZ19_05955 [Synechococcus sp. L2F]|uniref:hypothetical protein n=1 Tax=Synechococcus sp. L2F TaxID=2823739 RepID=UPI0020CD02DA|nr:hypothetical protein [Synechococcus sp. L2F]MCP9828029.1 hypothetical protein [Synechococcus sp. L2F]